MIVFLIVLALVVLLGIALAFVIKWMFILAIVAALAWLITFFAHRTRANL